jgi:hypothetical protein
MVVLLISTSIVASAIIDQRVDTIQIYGAFQSQNQLSTYKFVDDKVTCYGQVAKLNNVVTSQSLSCVK